MTVLEVEFTTGHMTIEGATPEECYAKMDIEAIENGPACYFSIYVSEPENGLVF